MATPFIPVSPKSAARNIAGKMSQVREGLMVRGEYLVDPTIVEKVAWEPHGSSHRLVILPPPSLSLDTREATPFADGSETATTDTSEDNPSPTPGNASDPQQPAGDTPVDPPAPAILTIVTQLVPGQSWLYPDARWTGPTKFVKRFTDVKLLCTGGAAAHPQFVNDYATAIANLNTIMGKVGDPRNERNTVVSRPGNNIRIRHQLFTEYEDADAADPADVAYTRAWPTSTPEAAEALAAAAETHQVNPLPAYDQNGRLLEPQYYTKRLDGATVAIRFELNHFLIYKGKDQRAVDTFSARLVQIRIILPPPGACPATPRKKKVALHDNYFGSFTPTKRGRDDDDSDKENGPPAAKTMRCIASSSRA